MTRPSLPAAGLLLTLMAAGANAEPQANAPADMKLTDEQCVTIWKQAHAADKAAPETETLSLAAVQPYIKDMAKVDMDRDKLISTKEWADACKAGLVMTSPAVPAQKVPEVH